MAACTPRPRSGVAQRLLLQAQTALGSYAEPGWASRGWPAFADRLLELARAAEPGFGPPAGLRQRAVHSVLALRHVALWPRCSTPTRRHGLRASSSTPTCVAHRHRACRRRYIDADGRRHPSSTPRRSATRPPRVNATPPRPRRHARSPRSRTPRGSRSSRTTRCPTSPAGRHRRLRSARSARC